jgi:predicted dehydrogenase
MGTGRIARALAKAVVAESGRVVAVSSASPQRARDFAAEHDVAHAYGAHHDLLGDDTVDVVYVATTNDRHHADVLASVQAGVAVLAEKPFTLDLDQAREIVAAARSGDSFLMEAMWMAFQPAFVDVQRRVEAGEIGTPLALQADIGFPAEDPTGRLFTPGLGGGVLLDIGVYPLTLARLLLGEPDEIRSVGTIGERGVDTQVAASMRHGEAVSSWIATMRADTGVEATVAGAEGGLRLHSPFHHAGTVSRLRRGEVVEARTVPGADLEYRHEVREVHGCLDRGEVESKRMPWEFTLRGMRALDEIRAQLGIDFAAT